MRYDSIRHQNHFTKIIVLKLLSLASRLYNPTNIVAYLLNIYYIFTFLEYKFY